MITLIDDTITPIIYFLYNLLVKTRHLETRFYPFTFRL